MAVWQQLRRLALGGGIAAGALVAVPQAAGAQAACTAGPLSAYLASAGLGCTFGQLKMNQFASGAFASVASQVFVNPFTLQGPPGFTWVGFTVRFGTGLALPRERPLDFSFWSNNAPLFGLLAGQDISGSPTFAGSLRGRLAGDGGLFRAFDRVNSGLVRSQQACGQLGSSPATCVPGTTQWTAALPDGDNAYRVDATSFLGAAGTPYDYTIAVLADQSTVTPEPATLLLLSSGLGGVGAIARRRRKTSTA